MALTPGADKAFKPTAAPAAGIKPQQVGGLKFPGKINTKMAMPTLPATAPSNPALGAMLGLLFGRVVTHVPGVNKLLTNPMLRDAAIGAAIVQAMSLLKQQNTDPAAEIYNPRPDDPAQNGWNLQ
jgi:hypothetical protein